MQNKRSNAFLQNSIDHIKKINKYEKEKRNGTLICFENVRCFPFQIMKFLNLQYLTTFISKETL